MTKKNQKNTVQQKGIHDDKKSRYLNSTYSSTNYENHKPEWHTSSSQPGRFQRHFIISCALQIDAGNFTKELKLDPSDSSDINQDYLNDNIYPTNPTGIKNGADSCQENNPKQESMKINTESKDPSRFNSQQNTDGNPIIQYEKTNGKTFIRSYRMNLSGTAVLLAETGIKYPYLTEIGKGAMITRTKPQILPVRIRLFIAFLVLPHNQRPFL